jgi:hypothetical protein
MIRKSNGDAQQIRSGNVASVTFSTHPTRIKIIPKSNDSIQQKEEEV